LNPIPTLEGWLYLAVVIELFSRPSWLLDVRDVRREIVIDPPEIAWFERSSGKHSGLIFHSDRGSQYAGRTFHWVLYTGRMLQGVGMHRATPRANNFPSKGAKRGASA